MTSKVKLRPAMVALGGVCLVLSVTSDAQIRTIPKEGLPGLSKETVEFEIEHNYRRENNLGQTVAAEEGTRPNSSNPQVLDGIWLQGRTYSVNADGTYSEAGGFPGMGAAAGMGAGAAPTGAPPGGGAPPGAAPGGAPGGGMAAGPGQSCSVSFSVTMGMPSKIVQTDKVMYILTNSQNSGLTYRRIEMNASHPANLAPSALGHSVGRWEGDTLVVETIGLKGGSGGGNPFGPALSFSSTSKVTERIKKIEGGLKLENLVTVEDTLSKQTSKQRVVSFYRPDLQYVEAPCEEYSDPFADAYGNPEASAKVVSELTKKAEGAK